MALPKKKKALTGENNGIMLELTLGRYVRHKLEQLDIGVKKELMRDCLVKSGESLDEVDAAAVILKELWKRLRKLIG